MTVSLNTFYNSLGISKQAVHQHLNRELNIVFYEHQLLFLIHQLRQDHPGMCCRDLYYLLAPDFIGRDRFEAFCKKNGFYVKTVNNYRRTTDSSGVRRFPHLISGLNLERINQVWVSDITYFDCGNRTCYITFIMDAFSRRILGYHASTRLFTEQTSLPAMEMALAVREKAHLKGLIFHSDGGGQFYDNVFLQLTSGKGIKNSMCRYPWENGKAERINGIIKNNYLRHWRITSYQELQQSVDRAVKLYNTEKPHSNLNKLSPINYEKLYFSNGKTTDGEKSTTENENPRRRAILALRAGENNL